VAVFALRDPEAIVARARALFAAAGARSAKVAA
jgi:hypothetical protein